MSPAASPPSAPVRSATTRPADRPAHLLALALALRRYLIDQQPHLTLPVRRRHRRRMPQRRHFLRQHEDLLAFYIGQPRRFTLAEPRILLVHTLLLFERL